MPLDKNDIRRKLLLRAIARWQLARQTTGNRTRRKARAEDMRVSFADAEVPTGSNVTFTLSRAPNPPASLVLVNNGLVMAGGVDYTLSGATITMASPAGDLKAWYRY